MAFSTKLTPIAYRIMYVATVFGLNCYGDSSVIDGGTIHFNVLLPTQLRFAFSSPYVKPGIQLAVANVTALDGLLPGRNIEVHYANSMCSSAVSMNHMFNFYIQKKVNNVLFLIVSCIYCTVMFFSFAMQYLHTSRIFQLIHVIVFR